jgi:hypothetical protein
MFKAQPDLKWRLTKIVEAGSTVAAEWTWTSTYTGQGPTGPVKAQKITARGAAFAVVEGGHIRRFVDYYDFASAFPAPADVAKYDLILAHRLKRDTALVRGFQRPARGDDLVGVANIGVDARR